MQNLRRLGLFSALLFLSTNLTMTALAKPFTYINARFGTVCTFPDQIFTKRMPEPENGDGLEWHSADGASVACYGSYNALDDTPESLVKNEKASPEPKKKSPTARPARTGRCCRARRATRSSISGPCSEKRTSSTPSPSSIQQHSRRNTTRWSAPSLQACTRRPGHTGNKPSTQPSARFTASLFQPSLRARFSL